MVVKTEGGQWGQRCTGTEPIKMAILNTTKALGFCVCVCVKHREVQKARNIKTKTHHRITI